MEDFKEFFVILKRYLLEQKEYLALDAVEKLTVLVSALLTALLTILLCSMLLLMLSFAFALWLGDVLGSLSLGFLALAGLLSLAIFIFYIKRRQWVLEPTARLMVTIFLEKKQD